MRDAVNVGMCAIEELAEYDGADVLDEVPLATATPTAETPEGVTAAQIEAIDAEMKRAGWSTDLGRAYLRKHFKKESRTQLTREEAARMLTHLQSLPNAGPVTRKEGAAV